MKEKKIPAGKTDIFYTVHGKGKTIMLVHGFGEDNTVWRHQIAWLENDFQVIVPLLPGTGRSGMIDDMSMEGMAALLKKILDHENILTCTLIGHSMGGYIALAFVSLFPKMIEKFVLFHSTAYPDSAEKKSIREKGIRFIREYGAFEFLRSTTPNLFSPLFRDEHPEIVEKQIAGLSNFSAESLVTYYKAMMERPDRINVLKNSEFPVLFLAGKYDNAVPLQEVLAQSHLPYLSYIHILKKSGHMGMIEESEDSNRVLDKFLRDNWN
ncbi:MAG: alpha/beta fold hydrolase [Terrimonas sp.]|nr:alpha/beta fold hydrolase [Terrimonas sp.]